MGWNVQRASESAIADAANEIVDRLNDVALQRPINSDDLERIRFTIERLRAFPPVYLNLQAMVDSLYFDVDSVRARLDAMLALPAADVQPERILDFVVSLASAGDPGRAAGLLDEWSSRFLSPGVLFRGISLATSLGRIDLAEQYEKLLRKMDPSFEHVVNKASMVDLLSSRGLDSSDVAKFLAHVRAQLVSRAIHRVGAHVAPCATPSEHGPVLVALFNAAISPIEAVELEESITASAREAGLSAASPSGVLLMLEPAA